MLRITVQTIYQKSLLLLSTVCMLALFLVPVVVSAQATADDPFRLQESEFANTVNLGRFNLISVIANGIQIFLGILGIIVVVIFLYAGWMWMTSNGDEEKIGMAKKMMLNATIGLGIILASFAITEFIIRKLTQATGFEPDINCSDPAYATAFPERCDDDSLPSYCESYPTVEACLGDVFVVKSITPVTGSTGMNNVVIRVVFSKSVVTASEKTIRIYQGNTELTDDFTFSWIGFNRMLEAKYTNNSGLFASGTYRVVVQDDVRSTDNESLKDSIEGEQYPLEAEFVVTTDGVRDTVSPVLSTVKVNGNESVRHIIKRGTKPLITANISDDHGVGFVRFALQRFDEATLTDVSFEGPRVVDGSDAPVANPFEYASSWLFASNMSVPTMYTANLIAKDIDSNQSVSYTTEVVVVGESCDAMGGSVDPNNPDNSCLAEPGGPCSADWQCTSGVCDEEAGVCLPYPVILGVSPWSGAEGNMVSIIGKYFGDTEGDIYFGFDANNDTVISSAEWVPAVTPSVECPDVDLWNDNWAIVKVPDNDVLPMDSLSAIRIVRGDAQAYEDTTVNTRGPKAGDDGFVGYFRVTNESYPGLCSVKTVEGATEAKPETDVIARGVGFGVDRGQITFGGRQGTNIAGWSNFSAQARIPDNLQPGLVSVQVVHKNAQKSNAVPFRIRSLDEDVLPVIDFIDPAATTRQSFMTISGARFGTPGHVWVSPNSGDIINCGQEASKRPTSCIELTYGGYEFCAADWWSAKQIFAYIPETLSVGKYFVLVQTNTGLQTDGQDFFEVIFGAPRPSICSLKPDNGPAPLPVGASLEVRGINFFAPGIPITSNNTTGYFWRSGASVTDPIGTWLSTLPISNPSSTILRAISNSSTIKTTIPVLSSGVTMQTGPIVVFADGVSTNLISGYDFESDVSQWLFQKDEPAGYYASIVSSTTGVGNMAQLGVAAYPSVKKIAQMSQVISGLTPGAQYQVVFTAQQNNGTNNTLLAIVTDGSGSLVKEVFSLSDEWYTYSYSFVPTTASATLFWILAPSVEEAGTMNIDSVSLGRISPISSNRVTYTVNDCRTDRTSNMTGYQCCTEGPEAGVWKSGDAVCAGQTRDAGYVWRFTTGKLSNRPRVAEECKPDGDIPSPVPSTLQIDDLYRAGQNACVNQMVMVRFDVAEGTEMNNVNIPIQNSAQNPNNVILYTCGTGVALRESECEVEIDLTPKLEGKVLTVYDAGDDTAHLESNTWYRVTLSKNIQGVSRVEELGEVRNELVNILPTRPCVQDGVEYAYCFEFKTSELGEICTLAGAGITPREQHARILGRVTDVFMNEILFSVFGRGNQACTVLNVDKLGWNWTDANSTLVHAIPKASPRAQNDSKANADARQITTETGSDIFATVLLPQLILPSNVVIPPKGVKETRFQDGDINRSGCTVSIGGSVFAVSSTVVTGGCLLDGPLVAVSPVESGYNQLQITRSATQPYLSRTVTTSEEGVWSPFQSSSFSIALTAELSSTLQNGEGILLYYYGHYEETPTVPTELFYIMADESNRLRAYMQYPAEGGSYIMTTRALAEDTLYHIAFVYDRSTGKAVLYVNGENWGEKSFANVPTSVTSVGPFANVQVGYMYGNPAVSFSTSFGHMAVYNTALSPESVRALSDILRNVPPPVPVGSRSITATSTIIVNPGKPKVVDYWPRCTEACVNAGLGATFNRPMVTSTYGGNYVISRCTDGEICTSRTSVPNTTIALDTQQSDSQRIVFNLQGTNTFATNTWYVVSLTSGIRAYAGSETLFGDTLEPFSWKFRTKSDGTLCTLSSARVLPLTFIANVQYQKTLYSAQAVSAPDSCSPQGQVLNPWFFDWSWASADTDVATVSNIKSGGTYYPWCTNACLPAGSTIARTTSTPAMCGDGLVGVGEDCDIFHTLPASTTLETPGVSCTFACLRPGNNTSGTSTVAAQCGNGIIEYYAGEECDVGKIDGNEFCSSICTNKGSSANPTGSVAGSVCGSGAVTNGEECELDQSGCTSQCLRAGTPLLREWCDDFGYSTSTASSAAIVACKTASSVCGNGELESGEQCETVTSGGNLPTYCSTSCLITGSVCDVPSKKQCNAGTDGCTSNCTFAGASVSYTTPSVCGDTATGAVATGKDLSCEVNVRDTSGVVAKKGLPVQAVTAIGGNGRPLTNTTSQYYQTLISATALNTGSEAGEGDYYYQCGYAEYDPQPLASPYNNCVDPNQGVGANSCCYTRPMRVSEYPENGAGTGFGEEGVCRNTAIMAYMKGYIDQDTLNNNVRLVSYHPGAAICPSGLADVTGEYADMSIFSIAKNTLAPLSSDANIFERVWYRIRTFVARLFGESASAIDRTTGKLCAGIPIVGSVTIVGDGTYANTTSTVRLQIGAPLLATTTYYVTLDGGNSGIKDMFGVGIKHPTTSTLADAWSFRTGAEICKLDSVVVSPSTKLFRSSNTTSTFTAMGKTTDNQIIESIDDVYAYEWMWVPGGNPLFDIPVAGSERLSTSTVDISSKNIEGSLYASAVAIVTTDTDTTRESHVDKSFSGRTHLTSLFCNNVWPPEVGGEWSAFEDTDYHFRSFYCADAGTLGVTTDDLPVMNVVAYTSSTAEGAFGGSSIPGALTDADVIRRYLLVSDKNDDVIGVQILQNTAGLSVSEWYQRRFGSLSQQRVVIDGYEALTNGDTFYIGAYNQVTTTASYDKLYNNIYVVTINQGAQSNTRAVLDQFIRNLKFNTNIYDDQYCLTTSTSRTISSVSCTTDFDCRSTNGAALSGLSGVCGNDRTKFFNDLKRLQDIGAFQRAIDQYKAAHGGTVPTLSAGTYYPSYTNSMWPSWQGALGASDALSAALPRDPVNRWSQCGVAEINAQTCWDQTSATYACPAFSQIYEYKQNSTSTYTLHAGFEYLNNTIKNASGTPFINDFVNPISVSSTPWCVSQIRSPFGEKCGDGIVQPTETCEIGQTDTRNNVVSGGVYGTVSLSCNTTCSGWTIVGNNANMTCGNGIVERSGQMDVPNEVCDDGIALNGTYGQCAGPNSIAGNSAAACQQVHPQYCGNGSLDRLGATQTLEYCDNNAVAGVCEYVTESGVQVKPKVYVMLDRSQSMGTVRWSNAKVGLDIFASSSASLVETGLAVFAGDNSCGAPRQLLAMGSNTIGQIQSSYSSESANSWTPTDVALQYVYDNRSTIFGLNRDIPKIVILVTDGEPVCPGESESIELKAARQQRAVTNAQLLRNAGIAVHVIGFGDVTSTLKENLNQIAEAGGTDNANDPDNRFYDASNATQLSTAIQSILSCRPYNATRAGSCAYDCQSVGSYCGDGVTDLQFGEQCDDANTNPTDTCDNTCKTVVNPQAPARDPGRHYCGDAVRDWDDKNKNDIKDAGENWIESCDTGAANLGKRPTPESIPYGEVRTYCSVDCQDILTVDSVARCGNGKRDVDANGNWIEACDTRLDGSVTLVTNGDAVAGCTDMGSRTCTNNCQTYTDSCVSCTVSSSPQIVGFATPQIALLNPMIGIAASGSGQDWEDTVDAYFYRPSTLSPVGLFFDFNKEDLGNYTQYQNIFNDTAKRVMADNQCRDQYRIGFNNRYFAATVPPDAVSSTEKYDVFSYVVDGEFGIIKNEYVVSPAVPTNTYRVVVRWTDKENDSANFVLNAISDRFGINSNEGNEKIISYTSAIAQSRNTFVDGRQADFICDTLTLVNGSGRYPFMYWWPTCDGYISYDSFSSIFVHDIVGLEKTFVHSLTIDTSVLDPSSSKPIGVYVSAVSASAPTIINEFRNSDVFVDVYTYHVGQNQTYSIYAPTQTFSIKNAQRSANPDAPFWHVFNLVKQGGVYVVQEPTSATDQPAGSIVTDVCGIRNQMPNTSPCVE